MAAVVNIISRHGLRIDTLCKNQPNKSKLALHNLAVNPLLTLIHKVTRRSASVIKVGVLYVGVCISRHLKEERLELYINSFRLLVI